jgi:hypothetical protein
MMNEILRKLRGMVGVAATWGLAWGAIFATIGLVIWVFDPDSIGPGDDPLLVVRIGATYGLITGASFGVLLGLAERNRSIADLSLARVALWGAVAASVFPLVSPANNAMLVFLCPIGAGLAAGSIALAKRAERAALPPAPLL